MTTPRLGLRLTLSAIDSEYDLLRSDLCPFWDFPDYIDRASDQQLMANLKAIQKHSNRIMAMAEAEMSRLAKNMNRHAVAAE
jgi:hypothetical protein